MRSMQPMDAHELAALGCPWCGRVRQGGVLGFKVVRDKVVLGAIVLAPDRGELGVCPSGTAVVRSLWVRPEEVGEHVGTQLVERAAAHLRAGHARCLVSAGTRGTADCARPPASWLEHVGFVEHVAGVQWRLDLRRTLPLVRQVSDALDAAVRAFRPARPAPAGRNAAMPASRS